jgi:hypothetical protein
MAVPRVPACPVCGGHLEVVRLSCPACDIRVEGRFASSPFTALSAEQVDFVRVFLAARGNIKLVERQLGISYPTVRSRLQAVQQAMGLKDLSSAEEARPNTVDVLNKLAAGELSVDEAIDSLD